MPKVVYADASTRSFDLLIVRFVYFCLLLFISSDRSVWTLIHIYIDQQKKGGYHSHIFNHLSFNRLREWNWEKKKKKFSRWSKLLTIRRIETCLRHELILSCFFVFNARSQSNQSHWTYAEEKNLKVSTDIVWFEKKKRNTHKYTREEKKKIIWNASERLTTFSLIEFCQLNLQDLSCFPSNLSMSFHSLCSFLLDNFVMLTWHQWSLVYQIHV